MKKLFLLLMLLPSACLAGTITVNTGYGYLTDSNGHITDKEILPIGNQTISDAYTYTEVSSQSDLDSVIIYVDPKIIKATQKAALQAQLDSIDAKSIRAIRTNDTVRMAALE